MIRPAIALLPLILTQAASGAWSPAGRDVAYSQSGQFIVTGSAQPAAAARKLQFDPRFNRFVVTGWTEGHAPGQPSALSTNPATLALDPKYLVATAERLRLAFNDSLDLHDPYRGKIYINLLDNLGPGAEITFLSAFDRPKQTWNCKIAMPAELAPDRLVRVLLQALIFEATHRGAGESGCEVPAWFTEGLIAHLDSRAAETSVFDPHQSVNRFHSAIEEARELSEAIGPDGCLTLEQLSWPGLLEREPRMERAFHLSSHALLLELQRLRGGEQSLGRFVRLLPRYQNWQFAFLHSFQSHFPSLLDAEKWWAITSLHLDGKGVHKNWTLSESLRRLDEAIVLRVEKHAGADEEVRREEMDLPTLLTTIDYERQKTMLARVISGLFGLELRAEPRVARLVGDYRATLEKYVADRSGINRITTRQRQPRTALRPELVIEATLEQLEALATLRRDFELLLPEKPAPEVKQVAGIAATTR
jgi:hypothetical protein